MVEAVPMTPGEIVHELSRFIIGQDEAKRKVAIALRNRWRRRQIKDLELQAEITPKNILMIGPTGVGKTEIARRLANLIKAPFLKVEATKFTEVGYVGRDVESIIRDLVDIAIKQTREREMEKVRVQAEDLAEERILNALLRPPIQEGKEKEKAQPVDDATRQKFRKKLREGDLDDQSIELDVATGPIGVEIMGPPGMEDMTSQLQSLFQSISTEKIRPRKLKIIDAKKHLCDEEAAKLINEEEIKTRALTNVEQNGIVFIDEIDKVVRREGYVGGGEVSREGVQRDLLPLVEGCTVSTRYGMIRTDHILFIGSGAFLVAKPSDLIPELQGRFPIRVELDALSVDDFEQILLETDASLTKQYSALLDTEKVKIKFTKDGIGQIAKFAWKVNEETENIGARRLYTVMERLLEDISFSATEKEGTSLSINAAYVKKQLEGLIEDTDLSRYIL